jgi:hypothetical protein
MADGGGFLEGLKELLLGGAAPVQPPVYSEKPSPSPMTEPWSELPPGGMPQPASPAPTPLAPQPKPGLLSQLGHYITSPEGLLTIGTTLRAGGGDKEAFQDQARILNRMDEQRALGRKTAQ